MKDIKNSVKCIVSDECDYFTSKATSLDSSEQELVINSLRSGLEDATVRETYVDCSDQTFLTKLFKSEFFTLTEVLYSERTDFVLAIKGILENSGLTIRTKKQIFSEEEKASRSARMKKLHERV